MIERGQASTTAVVRSKTFDAFLSMATEKEVEELLTYHARVKKSIDMFFGSPAEKRKAKEENVTEAAENQVKHLAEEVKIRRKENWELNYNNNNNNNNNNRCNAYKTNVQEHNQIKIKMTTKSKWKQKQPSQNQN